MQGGPVDELLDVAVEVRPSIRLEVEVGRTVEDRSTPVVPEITGKSVTSMVHQAALAISARLTDRLPWERNGTSDPALTG